MSYQPSIITPIFFAYNSSNQTVNGNTVMNIDSSLYAGLLSSNNLTQTQRSTSVADVKYNMSANGLRATTTLRNGTTDSVSKGYNVNGSGGGANGVCDELAYSTFEPADLNLFCNPRTTGTITMQATYTRLTGALIS